MKAKIYVSEDQMEIRLSNDDQFFSEENESKEKFVKRTAQEVRDNFLEPLEITHEMDIKKVKKMVSAQIERRLTVISTGVEKMILLEVLEGRGYDFDQELTYNEFGEDQVDTPPETSSAPEKTSDRKEALAAFKLTEKYIEARKHIGRSILYKNRGFKKEREAVIKGVLINRSATKADFRVIDEDTGEGNSCILKNIVFIDEQ